MIATARFVHIHLHKSGGTFVNECLRRFFPEARALGYHLPRRLIPPELRALPVIGFVRNPWSYYVSWYAFQSQRPEPNALFRVASANGRLDFAGTLRNLVSLADGGETLETLLAALPDAYTGRGLNLPRFALAPIRGSGLGFYSYLCDYMYAGDDGELLLGRTDSLRNDLAHFFERLGVPVSTELARFIADAEPRNVSVHAPYPSYYDDAGAALVAERDGALIERFGFRFGD